MSHPTNRALLSPGFRDLLEENRRLSSAAADLRVELARLVGYYEKTGVVPLAKLAALLDGEPR